MNDTKVYIFTEAGEKTGYGHLSRCGALGEELKRRGADVGYVVNGTPGGGLSPVIVMNWADADYKDISFIENHYCIIDSYIASEHVVDLICSKAKKCLCVDDNNIRKYLNCLIVNPALFAGDISYELNAATKLLAGSEYIILREPFRKKFERAVQKEVNTITVTIGGADVLGLVPEIAGILFDSGLERSIRINYVISGNAKYCCRLFKLAEEGYSNAAVHTDLSAEDMCRLFLNSDLVISAGGQTINELVQCRTPGIFICVADNQRRNVTSAIKNGFGIELNPREAKSKIITAIEKMNYELRLEIVRRMEKFDFSNGVKNIIDRFLGTVT